MLQYQTIDAIPARPPAHSLVTVAGVPNAEHRFSEGGRWLPEQVGIDGGIVRGIDRGAGGTGNTASLKANAASARDERLDEPFVVAVAEDLSTLGTITNDAEDFIARRRRALASIESYLIARELWDGPVLSTLSGSNPDQSFSGVGAATSVISDRITTSAQDIVEAFAIMEAGMASVLGGRLGTIHCTPQVLVHAFAAEVVRPGENAARPTFRSIMGHTVIADAGYSGNGPGTGDDDADATSQWMFGTGPIAVHLGPIDFRPTELATVEAIARDDNDLILTAQRPVMIQWDPDGCLLAVEVAVGTPVANIGGAS